MPHSRAVRTDATRRGRRASPDVRVGHSTARAYRFTWNTGGGRESAVSARGTEGGSCCGTGSSADPPVLLSPRGIPKASKALVSDRPRQPCVPRVNQHGTSVSARTGEQPVDGASLYPPLWGTLGTDTENRAISGRSPPRIRTLFAS